MARLHARIIHALISLALHGAFSFDRYCAMGDATGRKFTSACVSTFLEFHLPANSEILYEARNNDSDVGMDMNGDVGALCGWIERTRGCMNISAADPFLYGLNCSGKKCMLLPSKENCILRDCQIGYSNETRVSEAGRNLEGWKKFLMQTVPNQLTAGYTHTECTKPKFKLSMVKAWLPRVNGTYHFKLQAVFNETLGKYYHCVMNPVCAENMLMSKLVCLRLNTRARLKKWEKSSNITKEGVITESKFESGKSRGGPDALRKSFLVSSFIYALHYMFFL